MDHSLSGTLKDGRHRLPVRVYFEDTDFSGVVYHARYLHFFERGRTDFLRLSGVHHKELEDGTFGEPLYFVVSSMTLDFRTPAKIDDILNVETTLSATKGVRLIMQQVIRRNGTLIAEAVVTAVLIGADKKPRRLPNKLKAALGTSKMLP